MSTREKLILKLRDPNKFKDVNWSSLESLITEYLCYKKKKGRSKHSPYINEKFKKYLPGNLRRLSLKKPHKGTKYISERTIKQILEAYDILDPIIKKERTKK